MIRLKKAKRMELDCMKTVTIDEAVSWLPCDGYTQSKIEESFAEQKVPSVKIHTLSTRKPE